MHRVYIAIGTNIEPRLKRIQEAFNTLSQFCVIEKKSSIYETAPYGYAEQADFLNTVILVQTELELEPLHRSLKILESELGRSERERWHEREIDFDILFYDDVVMDSPSLTVPHKELQNRSFVLVPMNEIAADFIHPVLKKNIASLLEQFHYDKNSIHLVNA